jgi:uncharacterized damage-inducible protein DinB
MKAEKQLMGISDSIVREMDQEAVITRRLLDIIPEDKLAWRPHPKAMSLGELAMHLATLQARVAALGQQDIFDFKEFPANPQPANKAEIQRNFAESLRKAKDIVAATSDAQALSEWKLTKDGNTLMAMPRIGLWRTILLNHNYHHRGQLSTYLRELDVPLPSIYGPSADENPFA